MPNPQIPPAQPPTTPNRETTRTGTSTTAGREDTRTVSPGHEATHGATRTGISGRDDARAGARVRGGVGRVAVLAGVAGALLVGVASGASAHVTANPDSAVQGSYAKVSFRVPNEEPKADTTKVVVELPADHPVVSVSVRPVPGWSVSVTESKLAKPVQAEGSMVTKAVSRITWTGGRITPGQFQEFDVSLGPLPSDTDRLVFKATQTYSSGEVVNWNQDPGNGGQEPEHPSPVLHLTPKNPAPKPAAAVSAKEDDGTARVLGWTGIGVGVLGLLAAAFAVARSRS